MATKSRLYNDTPYLPFATHETQIDASLDLSAEDVRILRALASQVAEIASLPEQQVRRNTWTAVNDLKGARPVLWANEVCWHEMNVDDELTVKCESELGFRLENQFRRTLYQWKHMRGDMVVENVIESPYIVHNSGLGIGTVADIAETDQNATIASRHFHNQITCMEDIQKIKDPVVTVDRKRTRDFLECYQMLFDGILPVRTNGCKGFWFAPWDDIVLWMGAEEVLFALIDEPEMMHALIDRLTSAYLCALDQYVALGLTASNNCNVRVGSGGYGYTGALAPDDGGFRAPQEMWGNATPQIFGSVSPAVHAEFGLAYEKRWMERFALNYYGCCEPLHARINMLAAIPGMRKISISPWADLAVAAEHMRGRFVLSLKPSPACLAAQAFDEEAVRKTLREQFSLCKGCSVEVIIKDISTVFHQPQRLWRWMEIAMEEAWRAAE